MNREFEQMSFYWNEFFKNFRSSKRIVVRIILSLVLIIPFLILIGVASIFAGVINIFFFMIDLTENRDYSIDHPRSVFEILSSILDLIHIFDFLNIISLLFIYVFSIPLYILLWILYKILYVIHFGDLHIYFNQPLRIFSKV